MTQTQKHKRVAGVPTSRQLIECVLLENGIRRGSSDWNDYERAKVLIMGSEIAIDAHAYERNIRIITQYLGL